MQPNPLIRLRYRQQGADLVGLEAGHVTQDHDLALFCGQRLDRRLDLPNGFAIEQSRFGDVAPAVGRGRPHPIASKATWVDRWTSIASPVAPEQGREGKYSRLFAPARTGDVEENPKDPGLQRRAALESIEGLE